MRQIYVDGNPVWVDVPRDLPRFCPACGGKLGLFEEGCSQCKAWAYEAQILKDRLEVVKFLESHR